MKSMFHEMWNTTKSTYLLLNYADVRRLSFSKNSMAPIKDGVLGGGGSPIGALNHLVPLLL
jgi:hypothetical protein